MNIIEKGNYLCHKLGLSSNFYVYVYMDPRKPGYFKYGEYIFNWEPFYIGKGTKNRIFSHMKEATHQISSSKRRINWIKINKIKSIISSPEKDPIIALIKKDMSNQQASVLENTLILNIGRKTKKTGPLTNLTEGGETDAGWKMSESGKEKLRLLRIGHKDSNLTRQKKSLAMLGKKHSKESILKMSISQKGHPVSEQAKIKLREANIGKKATKATRLKMSSKKKGIKRGQLFSEKMKKVKTDYFYTAINTKTNESINGFILSDFCKEKKLKRRTVARKINTGKMYKEWLFTKHLKEKISGVT